MNSQMNPLKFTNSGMPKITVPVTGFIRNSLLTLCLRILPCCLIVLYLNGCVGAGIPIPYPFAVGINELGEKIETKWQAKRVAVHQQKMAAYETQREGFVDCGPEVQCSESLKKGEKIKTTLLIVPGPGHKSIRQALKNFIPVSEHTPAFSFGVKTMYATVNYDHSSYRFRIYRQWEDWLWDLEIKFAPPDPVHCFKNVCRGGLEYENENLRRATSIMVRRFQNVTT